MGRITLRLLLPFILLSLTLAAIGVADVTNGLLAHYTFDSTASDVLVDAGGNGYHGSIHGATEVEGRIGRALWFDGSNDYVDVDALLPALVSNTMGTVAFWAKMDTADAGDHAVFSISRGADGTRTDFHVSMHWGHAIEILYARVTVNDEIQWMLQDSHGVLGGLSDQWVHVAVTHDGTRPRIYLNGDTFPSSLLVDLAPDRWFKSILADAPVGADTVNIGMLEEGAQDRLHFGGGIDDLRLYSRALSASEVTELAGAAPDDGLVLHYTFDDYDGTAVADESGMGNTGTVHGAAFVSNGVMGGAYLFDGVDDYIHCGDDDTLQITGDLTYSCWVKLESPISTQRCIMGRRDGDTWDRMASYLRTSVSDSGQIVMCYHDGKAATAAEGLYSGCNLAPGEWHHIAGVFEAGPSGAVRLYIDGQLVAEDESPVYESLNPRRIPVLIGTRAGKTFFNGAMDDVRIYNRAFASNEVYSLFEEVSPPEVNRVLVLNPDDNHWSGSDYVSVPHHADFMTNTFTVMAWVYRNQPFNSTGHAQYIFNKGWDMGGKIRINFPARPSSLSCGLGMQGSDRISVYVHDMTVPFRRWTHVAAVYSAQTSSAELFMDGVMVASTNFPGGIPMLESTAQIRIGQHEHSAANYPWHGYMDDVCFFDRALSASNINEYALNGMTGGEEGMVACWGFDDATANDASVNGHHGSFRGDAATMVMDVIPWTSRPDDLVLHYTFDDYDGAAVADESGMGNTGTVYGATFVSNGVMGGAYLFDGTDDYIHCGDDDSLQITGDLTYSCWVKLDTPISTQQFIMGRRGGDMWYQTASTLRTSVIGGGQVVVVTHDGKAATSADGVYSGCNLLPGEWHHLAGVFVSGPSGAVRLYIDGQMVAEDDNPVYESLNSRRIPVFVGTRAGKTYFNGAMDDVRIYNRALASNEVCSLYEDVPFRDVNRVLVLNPDDNHWSGDDYVSVPHHADFMTNTFTVMAWVYRNQPFNATGHAQYIFNKGWDMSGQIRINFPARPTSLSCVLGTRGSDRIGVYAHDMTVPLRKWTHVAAVYNAQASSAELFMDGAMVASEEFPGGIPMLESTAQIRIGQHEHGVANYPWHGYMDDVCFFDRALSASNINAYALNGMTGAEEGMVACWGFDDATANDGSANGHHGSFRGDATTVVMDVTPWTTRPAELVLHYTFDTYDGVTVPDESGTGNDGIVRGTVPSADARLYGAYAFDGIDDRVSCGLDPSLQITGDLTYMTWVRKDGAGQAVLIGRRNGDDAYHIASHLSANSAGGATFGICSGRWEPAQFLVTEGVDLDDGQWYHLTGVYEAGKALRLYVNGALNAEKTNSVFASLNDRQIPVYMGARENTYFLRGAMDDARIYNRALAPEEIVAIYGAAAAGKVAVAVAGDPAAYDMPTPLGYGTNWVTSDEPVSTAVSSQSPGDPGVRYACAGWRGSGDVPVSGSTNVVTFTPSQASTLTWIWETEYRLVVSAGSGGSVDVADAWHPMGTVVTLTPEPEPGYAFDGWVGNVPAGHETDDPLSVAMDQPRSITATFYPSNLAAGLQLHYTFDEHNGVSVADESGMGNTGAVHGASFDSVGIMGGAYLFDGVDDYIHCGDDDSLQITGDLTYSCWVKLETPISTQMFLMGRRDGDTWNRTASTLMTSVTDGGQVVMVTHDGEAATAAQGVYSGCNLAAGEWHHIAGVFVSGASGAVRLYIDGQLVAEDDSPAYESLNPRRIPVFIGTRAGKTYFDGAMDDVRIYGRSLSSNEVAALYEAAGPGRVRLVVEASEGGTVDPGSGLFEEGAEVELTAFPSNGCAFVAWLGDVPPGSRLSNPVTVVMDGPRTVRALFWNGTQMLGLHWNELGTYFPGENTVYCRFYVPDADELMSLVWTPELPGDWSLVDARGDGGPSVLGNEIVFTRRHVQEPVEFSYTVAVPAGTTAPRSVGGVATYQVPGMSNPEDVTVLPDPLVLRMHDRGFHSADYQEDRWVIDARELSRVLFYWRAGWYRPDPEGYDGYTGTTEPYEDASNKLHSADYRRPRWSISAVEANRVLAYWRAGGYRIDPCGKDGYAPAEGVPGLAPPPQAASGPQDPQMEGAPTEGYDPGGTVVITNVVAFDNGLLALCIKPVLPPGWTILDATAEGDPEVAHDEILWTGSLPSSPVTIVYTVRVPATCRGTRLVSSHVEAYVSNASNATNAPTASTQLGMNARDADGDGLPDGWEETYADGTNSLDPGSDDDGDGLDNRQEWIAGTDPTNAASVLVLTGVEQVEDSTLRLTWQSALDRRYRVVTAGNTMEAFAPVQTNLLSTPPANSAEVRIPAGQRGLFRVDVRD